MFLRKALILILLLFSGFQIFAQINIWSETNVKKRVTLTPFIVKSENEDFKDKKKPVVIVCPGGSYFWHDFKVEGEEVAKWLNSNGISAFVLEYRTASAPAYIFRYRVIFRGVRYPDAQNDLLQAIRYIKAHSKEYEVDTTKIGALGFSAGGHLVMSAAEFFEKGDKPFFVAAIYPVVTMREKFAHARSRRALLGESRMYNKKLRDSLSLELHVPEDCPPVFLVNCKDDHVVDFRHSLILDSALTQKNIPHRYILYSTGGHGFGTSQNRGTSESRGWMSEFLSWLKEIY